MSDEPECTCLAGGPCEVHPHFPDWPNCPTPDCENKVNQWANLGLCSPCSERIIGKAELDRRWAATREPGTLMWSGVPYSVSQKEETR